MVHVTSDPHLICNVDRDTEEDITNILMLLLLQR